MHPTGQENFVPAVASSHAASLVSSSAIFQPGSFLNVEPQCPEDQYGNISRLSFSQDRSVYVRESPSTNCEGKNASETDLCRDRSLMLFLEPCSGTFKSSESQKILSVGLETLEGISKPCYAENSQQTHMQAAGPLQDAISRDQNMFARDSSFKSKVALEDGCSEAVMPQQSFSKMNHFEQQAHVAQQLRRDKLRIPGSYHSSPPRAGNQIQRSAFSLLPMQQHAQQDVEIIQQSDISERSGCLKGYAQRCVGQTASGELLSVYTNNEGAVATDEYNYPVGLELLSVPSGGGNLLKTSVSDVFQTPPESVPFHASQPVQRGDYNGQSNAVSQKWTNSNFMDSSNQQGNINTLGNFGVSQHIQGVQAPERSHTVNNCWTSSALTESTIQEGLLGTSARSGSLGSHKPSSKTSDESLQVPHLIRNGLAGYTDPLNLRNLAVSMTHNSNPFANNMQHQQQYERMSFVPSTISHKASVVQPFMADISSSAHERLCSNPNILCSGGEYGYCSKWSNRGTELLLLPGNDVLENSQARSSDMHNSILGSSSIYGVGQGALPYVQWERQDLVSGRDGRIIPMEAFGSLRQGQGLSLSLSGQQQFPCDFYGFDTRMPHSGSFNILRNSKYLKAAQQLLQEICNVGKGLKRNAPTQMISNSEAFENASSDPIAKGDSCSIETSCRKEGGTSIRAVSYVDAISEPASHQMHPEEKGRLQLKKTRLVAMVEEVDRRYGQYQEQMQMVMTSFESATGLGAAAPYTSLARQAMSRHFRCLRDAISDQIQGICKDLGEEPSNVPVLNKGETPRLRILDQKLRHQRALQQIGMLQHQAWRPQRGLPERAVSVLRAWLFEHFLHPYPKDTEKLMLARQTGLTRSQVSNWFINARVRLWKPMVEEMYLEESKDSEVEGAQAPATKRVNNGAKNKGQQVGVDPCMTQEVTKSPTSNQERRGSNDGASCSHTRPRVSDHDYASDPNTSESEFAAEARRSEETATELTTVGAQPFQTAMESTTLNNGQKGMNFYGSSRLVITNASGKDGDMQYEGEVGERSGKMYRSHPNYERSRGGREDHNGGVSVQDIANLESGCNRGFRDSSSHSAMGWRFMRNGGGDEEA